MDTILTGRAAGQGRLGVPLTPPNRRRPPGLHPGAGICAALARAADMVLTWQERASQRAALASLDERMLKDIGLTRADAAKEVRRPFWQA